MMIVSAGPEAVRGLDQGVESMLNYGSRPTNSF